MNWKGTTATVLFLALAIFGVFSIGVINIKQTQAVPPSGIYFDHVLAIMMENEGLWDICHQAPPPCQPVVAPYMAGLANNFTIGSMYLGLIGTSQPNYVAMIGGSMNGCTSSGCPVITAPNLVDRFESVGLTWKGYFENQITQGCDSNSPEPYTSIHNPFLPYQDISSNTARCNRLVRANPSTCIVVDCVLLNDLNNASQPAPNFMWLTPNDCNDMRGYSGCTNGCTSGGSSTCITRGDNYLKDLLTRVFASRTFQNERSVVFVTFDEGDGYCPLDGSNRQCLYAVWAGPVTKTKFVSSNLYSHYSFTKTVEVNWNLATLSTGDASAAAMTEFFKPTTATPDFLMSSNPSSLSFTSGGSATSTITLTSLNSFSGTVSLSASVSASGITASLSPTSVVLSSGGVGSATLALSSSTSGSYIVTVTGTSGSLLHTTSVSVTVNPAPTPDFGISSSPSSLSFTSGGSATSTITLTSLNSFSGTVSLSSTVSSSGLTASLNPTSVAPSSGGTGSSTLTVSSSTPGSYTVTVTGTSGSLVHSTSIAVTVNALPPPPDFSISSSPSSLSIQTGSSATSTISLASLNGFSGTVTLSASAAPSTGLNVSLAPTSVTMVSGGSGTSTLTISSSTVGSYMVTITGTSGSIAHSTQVSVDVLAPDFGLDVSPSVVDLNVGSSTTLTVALTSLGGFSGTIGLNASSSSSSLTATLGSSSVALVAGGTGSTSLTLSSSTVGSYSVTVTASSGPIVHAFTVPVDVQDFSLTLSTSSITVARGSTGTVTITLASINGFAGTVSVSASCTPSGPKLNLSSSSVSLSPGGSGSSTLTIRTLRKTAPGTYTVTITGTNGGLTRTATVLLTVT